MPSNTQIIILLVMVIVAPFVLGWQFKTFINEKTVHCPWNKCVYNRDGCCAKKIGIELVPLSDDHFNGLICSSFKEKTEQKAQCRKEVNYNNYDHRGKLKWFT